MIRRTILTRIFICATFLSACGDGNNGDGAAPIDMPLQVGGIWNGEATISITQPGATEPTVLDDTSVTFFTTEADPETGISEFRLVSDEALQAKGTIAVTEGATSQEDDALTGSFTAFAPDGFFFSDGMETAACAATGIFMETIDNDSMAIRSVMITYTCTDMNSQIMATGSIMADYDAAQYEQPSSFNRAAGTWSGLDFSTTNNDVELSLDFSNDDGMISGDNNIGCFYAGQLEIIDAAFNLYGISLTLTQCQQLDGTYTGLATLTAGLDGNPDEFTYQVDNDTRIITQPVFQFRTPSPPL
mgnify:CR=1 FL=1